MGLPPPANSLYMGGAAEVILVTGLVEPTSLALGFAGAFAGWF